MRVQYFPLLRLTGGNASSCAQREYFVKFEERLPKVEESVDDSEIVGSGHFCRYATLIGQETSRMGEAGIEDGDQAVINRCCNQSSSRSRVEMPD